MGGAVLFWQTSTHCLMRKRNRFREWLYEGDLAETAKHLGVTKTTIREWRTGRAYPHPLRHAFLLRMAARVNHRIDPTDLHRSAK